MPSQAGASLWRLLTSAAITVQQVHALKKPAHGEIPRDSRRQNRKRPNNDVGRMILPAPPQHPAIKKIVKATAAHLNRVA